jgi:hypothetical protein
MILSKIGAGQRLMVWQVLKTVLINLDNLLHVRRNPSVKFIKFSSYRQFIEYTRIGHYVPREGAKSEGFVSIFLRNVIGT